MNQPHAKRLSTEELRLRLPKILGSHERKVKRHEERKNMRAYREATQVEQKVAVSIGDAFRKARAEGATFRDPKGRFLSIPKK